MHDDTQDPALLGGEQPAPTATPDPLTAVMAVAQPREEAAAGNTLPATENESVGMLVETTVRVESGEVASDSSDTEKDARREAEKDPLAGCEWPDGYIPDPEALARFAPVAKKLGLSPEAARELALLHAELDAARHKSQAEFIARNNAEWLREIQSHPEFGGRNLQRTGQSVAATLRRYGSPLLLAQIRQMNVQNWPEMFYFLARVSRAASEDCSPASGGGAAAQSTAQLLFPGLK